MPEPTSYAPGTPSWVDLGSPDPDASATFYGELFGWETTEPGPIEETGGYRMFQQDGKPVGGLMRLMQEGQPTAWSSYVSVDSADETAARVAEAGGQTIVEPMDVMDIGRMAFFADRTGAVIGVWQPRTFVGAGIVNEPVSLAWNELMTRDPDAAKTFYATVFGWDTETVPAAADGPASGMEYWTWLLDGKRVGGMIRMTDQWPAEVPANWGVYFAVEDTDATIEKAKELGGSLVVEPMDLPVGRFASLTDPHGAFFTVIALSGA